MILHDGLVSTISLSPIITGQLGTHLIKLRNNISYSDPSAKYYLNLQVFISPAVKLLAEFVTMMPCYVIYRQTRRMGNLSTCLLK